MPLDSIKNIFDDLCSILHLNKPVQYVGSGTTDSRQLVSQLITIGRDLLVSHDWRELKREHSIYLSDGVSSYDYPVDYERVINDTQWSTGRTTQPKMPIDSVQYQYNKNRLNNYNYSLHFASRYNGRIIVQPTPSLPLGYDPEDHKITFEYISNAWIIPQLLTPGLSLQSGQEVWANYNGVYYRFKAKTTETAVSGVIVPFTVILGNSESIAYYYDEGNGNMQFERTPVPYGYSRPQSDTDIPLFDSQLISLGVQYKNYQNSGFDSDSTFAEYEAMKESLKTAQSGARKISMRCGEMIPYYLMNGYVPDIFE